MRKKKVALSILALTMLTCSGRVDREADREAASLISLRIETEPEHYVRLGVEVADTDAERQRGLMGRASLPELQGMAFLFDQPTAGGFWMKDTLIPLSIAFWDESGRILEILDMEPCRADPCPVYTPGVTYVGALEVNQGLFERTGVGIGDRIEIHAIV